MKTKAPGSFWWMFQNHTINPELLPENILAEEIKLHNKMQKRNYAIKKLAIHRYRIESN